MDYRLATATSRFVAGIDLGSSRRRRSTALAILDLRAKSVAELHTRISRADGIQDQLPPAEDVVAVAIDCPLSRPLGGSKWRASEERLHAEGISVFPSGASWTRDWVDLGIALADRLTTLRYVPIEVYPYASRVGLRIGIRGGQTLSKHKADGRAAILADLERLGIHFGRHRETLARDHDALDSAICAFTGLLWTTKSGVVRDIGESRPFVVPQSIRGSKPSQPSAE
jgi:predicted nuclease with RNAse H fold